MGAIDERTQHEIVAVEAAIQRLRVGSFGFCTTCGEAIDPACLGALPTAVHCRDCAG